MPKREYLVVVGDLHINSTIAVCPEKVRLDDGGLYEPSRAQVWINDCWAEFWQRVAKVCRKRAAVVVLNGDLVDGNHHGTTQLISHNEAIQAEMALSLLGPVRKAASALYVVRGTEAHTGPAAMWEEHIASSLGAVRADGGQNSHWHLPLMVGGVRFDIAHHPSTWGRMAWTRGAGPSRCALDVRLAYLEDGWETPDVVVRGHVHKFDRGYSEETMAVYCPSWQITTAFGHKLGAGYKVEPIGGMIFECSDGQYTPEFVRFRAKRGNPWRSRNPS